MEDIKSSLDKNFAKFNDSITHTAPPKLKMSLDFMDDFSLTPQVKKPRREENLESSDSSSNVSITVPPSPWESRRMKADLIEAKARINTLKQEIDQQHKVRAEVELLYQAKVEELKKQCSFSSEKVLESEKHMQLLRKREQSAKREIIRLQKELNALRQNYEENVDSLNRSKVEMEENMRQMENSYENQLGEYKRMTDKLKMEVELVTGELEGTKNQLQNLKERSSAYNQLKLQLEKDQQEIQCANSRIKELENKIATYNDWKEITKTSQMRLLNIPELEKQLEYLNRQNKTLQDMMGNKLLLEEQVHNLQTQLERETGARDEVVSLKVKIGHMDQELKEWIKVAQDHCLPNMLVSPMALRSRIEQILQNDICVSAEKSLNKSESKSKESELLDYKQKCDMYAKNIDELNVALKRHKNLKERLQRKLLLVSKERDCFKTLLENFESDLTISNTQTESSAREAQLFSRIEMLEKTLVGYKEMCANLEKEVVANRNLPNADQSIENALSAEGYDHIKKELDTLRFDNERLRRRKEELELELEQYCLKNRFDATKYKVLHLANNPASDAYDNAEKQIEKLQAEIARLKSHNKKLEEDNEATHARISETDNMTLDIKQLNNLRMELESANMKMKKMKELYKSASMEFREVCYLLFGYRIDRVGLNTNYKLSSMFAESPDDYLNFRLNESNVLDMLETPYSATLKPLIENQLIGNKSLPVFLSALTLELFQRSTVTIN